VVGGGIYELSPPSVAGGPWVETTLYTFSTEGEGGHPMAGVIRDASNNLYGTTYSGGKGTGQGFGVVFKLTPPESPGGAWTETVLHSFGGIANGDGADSSAELVLLNRTLYGTTTGGGVVLCCGFAGGTVFSVFHSLTP